MNVLNVLQAAERSIAKATDASHIVSASRRMWICRIATLSPSMVMIILRLKPHAADPKTK